VNGLTTSTPAQTSAASSKLSVANKIVMDKAHKKAVAGVAICNQQ
jgi:hypothetical protein